MKTENLLNNLRELIIGGGFKVSGIEYTANNYNDNGELIRKSLPTITTEHCEIGINKTIYLVFIIESKSFNEYFFNLIKDFSNIRLYGLKNFKETLYPGVNFNYGKLAKIIQQDEYLQVEFDFAIFGINIYNEYIKLVEMFNKGKIRIINQLEVNLKDS